MTLLDPANLPVRFDDVEVLDEFLARPTQALIDDLAAVPGDILILGVGGKMGPTLARLARNAAPERRIIGVARFSEPGVREQLQACGIETIACDLLDRDATAALPRAPNVIFMAGRKFGSSGNQPLTWAMNAQVPAVVADILRGARIVAFSTGNVYPMAEVLHGGATERTPPAPLGEYAQSCLARERLFEYFSQRHGTPGRLFRLNYAIDLRYGVLFDIATKVHAGTAVDVGMGHVNVIWQGDANAQALRCLRHCTVPASPINVSGSETLSVRFLVEEFAARFGRAAAITGAEASTAWLTNTTAACGLFGYPVVPLARMLDWVADWVAQGRPSFGRPTKFEVRSGVF